MMGGELMISKRHKLNADKKAYMCSLTSIVPLNPHKFLKEGGFEDTQINKINDIYQKMEVISEMIYESKLEADWIYNRIYQLKQMWDAHVKGMGHHTFHVLEKTSLKNIENLIFLIRIYHNLIEEILEQLNKNIEKGYLDFSKCITKWEKEIFPFIWKPLREIELNNNQFRQLLVILTNEYHFRMEGENISLLTFPFAGTAERTGISDLVLSAFHNLSEDYCPTLGIKGSNKIIEELRTFFKWDGVATAQLPPIGERIEGKNFYIDPVYEILYLPTEIKLQLREKLVPLSHEIGHFLISKVEQLTTDKYRYFYHPIKDEDLEDKKSINSLKNYIFRLVKLTQLILEEKTVFTIRLKLGEEVSDEEVDQLAADVIAFFLGGPLFFSTLSHFSYIPLPFSTIRYSTCPWLRVRLGIEICEQFRIYKYWKEPLNKSLLRIEASERSDTMEKIRKTWMILENGNVKTFIYDIKEWIYDLFESKSLFFPNLENGKDSRIVFRKCKKIAEQIINESAIIINEKPKYIAAAALLEPLKRPFYPAGHIFLSLYFSKMND